MNPDLPPSASGRECFSGVQSNTGQAPFAPNQFTANNPNIMQQFRPRMDQPYSTDRNEPLNQQQMHQQRNMPPNYQKSFRFAEGENPVRFPPQLESNNSARPNEYNQNFAEYQRNLGGFPQGPRMQMGPQRFPDPKLQIRPPVNDTNFVAPNQPKLANYEYMDRAKLVNHQMPPTQTLPQAENYKRLIPTDQPSILSRKGSTLDMNSSNNVNTKLIRNESKSQLEIKPNDNTSSGHSAMPKNLQGQDVENSKPEHEKPDNLENKNNSNAPPDDSRNFTKSDKKPKELFTREIKRDESKKNGITSGIVHAHIKFFETNDTAKTPLVPQEMSVKKMGRKTVTSADVVKCEVNRNDYESGVDETPMVYPNLRSIFETPRKLTKTPYRRGKGPGKLRSDKRSRSSFQVLFKSKQDLPKPRVKHNCSRSPYKTETSKAGTTKIFGPREELLAFFDSTDSWKKLRRYGSSRSDHNTTKENLENKVKANGDIRSPKKVPSATSKKNQQHISPARTPLKSPGTPGATSLPKTPDSPAPSTPLIKKVPMNKIQVGAAPSPNLKTVKSKIGSLANTTHKPGGGNVKIESHKIDLSNTQARIEAKNDQYKRSGGDKKIPQVKLQWSAKPKIGSLENATYKPGGGDKKIESVKLDFKEKAKPKVGSKDNVKHVPGGGNVKIGNQKLEFKAQSKVGSLDNVKHKPGGGDVKIFDDKTYLRQISGTSSEGKVSGTQSPLHTSVSKSFSETSQDGS